jgi:hypothetical protein
MSKQIDINHTFVKIPVRITVDGVTYPRNQHNINVVKEYWETGDEAVLDKLVDFSIVL